MKDYSLIKALYGSARQLAFKRIIPHVNHITHTKKIFLNVFYDPFKNISFMPRQSLCRGGQKQELIQGNT